MLREGVLDAHKARVASANKGEKMEAVYDYLTSRGVDPARLSSIGHGEAKPIADNATDEGRQLNRRVMLIRTDSGM